MQTQIGIGMSFGISCDFGNPGASHQNARRGDSVFVECVKTGRIDRVSDTKIVGVDDEEFRIGGVAEAFRDRLGLGRKKRDERKL